MTRTESTALSRTSIVDGTPTWSVACSPGTLRASIRLAPESGPASVTGAEKSNTTRVPVGADQLRIAFSVGCAWECALAGALAWRCDRAFAADAEAGSSTHARA